MLRINTTYPSFQLDYAFPRAEIKQQVSQVQIKNYGPLLEIDQRQSKNELGIGDYQYLSRQIRETSYRKVLASIARISQEGDAVMNRAGLFQREMIFSDLAKRRLDEKIPELNVAAAPQSRPEIRFHYGQEITWDQGGAFIKHHIQTPRITWHLGKVEVEFEG